MERLQVFEVHEPPLQASIVLIDRSASYLLLQAASAESAGGNTDKSTADTRIRNLFIPRQRLDKKLTPLAGAGLNSNWKIFRTVYDHCASIGGKERWLRSEVGNVGMTCVTHRKIRYSHCHQLLKGTIGWVSMAVYPCLNWAKELTQLSGCLCYITRSISSAVHD